MIGRDAHFMVKNEGLFFPKQELERCSWLRNEEMKVRTKTNVAWVLFSTTDILKKNKEYNAKIE